MNDQSSVKLRLNNSELWGGIIGLGLGLFVIRSGLKLKLGTINDPGSGYVLFYTGILMCLFAASIIVASLTGYSLANWPFKFSEAFFAALLLASFIPYVVMIYPLVMITRWLGI